MVNKLSHLGTIYDIFKHNHKFHPYTFGYNGENLKHYDQVLTAKEDVASFQTLDYMFEIKLDTRENSNINKEGNSNNTTFDCLKDYSDMPMIEENKNEGTGAENHLEVKLVVREENYNKERLNHSKYNNNLLNKNQPEKEDQKNKNKKLVVDYTTAEVEYFLVSDKPYQQLSDHFGLSVCLNYADL